MSLVFDFICPLPNGVHARPAVPLAQAARPFASEIILTNQRTGISANSKSVLAVISAGIRQGDACRLSVSGPDEATAMATLSHLFANTFTASNPSPVPPERTANTASYTASDLLHPGLIALDADCKTKADAIRHATALLHTTGRTKQPRELERAIWQREAMSSTGFGHGFAIPHCKSDPVLADSLVILKPRTPVDWGSTDDGRVRFIILMAMRKAGDPMTLFSRLARQLMHDSFRNRLTSEAAPAALLTFLKTSLNA